MNTIEIGIIGLGYVGLALALELSKKFKVTGYDKDKLRVKNLQKGNDYNEEHNKKDFKKKKINFTNNKKYLRDCNFYIVCVPTPVTKSNKPDLKLLSNACKLLGKYINNGDVVVFESTVYPGITENFCVKILEKTSKIPQSNINTKGFHIGYSPERVNPSDKAHNLKDIVKIVSSSSEEGLKKIHFVYSKIIKAGLHVAKSIQIAETAKVIENVQRDVNIALINEISIICNKLKISTYDVLEAAFTKWNFLKFYPGLVGGHCVGVDPYYLIQKSKQLGYLPKLMVTARNVNSSMVSNINKRVDIKFKNKRINILFMGATFKEDCSDLRNSLSLDLAKKLSKKHKVILYEPLIRNKNKIDGLKIIKKLSKIKFDAIIIALAHKNFKKISKLKIKSLTKKNSIIFDLKNIYNDENFETF